MEAVASGRQPKKASHGALWVAKTLRDPLVRRSRFLAQNTSHCFYKIVPAITNIVNLSLISGQFHPTLKESVISPLLKKPTLDKEELTESIMPLPTRPLCCFRHY